jgi:hypothetical protein
LPVKISHREYKGVGKQQQQKKYKLKKTKKEAKKISSMQLFKPDFVSMC